MNIAISGNYVTISDMDNQDELLPIVDEEGKTIGKMTRGEAHDGSKQLHPVVHLQLFNGKGEIYLQKRPLWKPIQPGKWDTACGGHVGYGESTDEALEREVSEELGIDVRSVGARFVTKYVFESKVERELVYVFKAVWDGDVKPSNDELDGGSFFKVEELKEEECTPNFWQEFFGKIMKTYSVYFSGTGNTKKVVKAIAQGIDSNAGDVNWSDPATRSIGHKFQSGDMVVFGVPTIAGRVPNVLLKSFVNLEGNGAKAVAVVTYGNRAYDDSLLELARLLKGRGFRVVGGAAFPAEHSFSRTLGAGRPDSEDLLQATEFGRRMVAKIADGEPEIFRTERELKPYFQPKDRDGNPINILKVKPVLDAGRCVECGRCVRACPMGSIDKKTMEVTGICIKCCACVKGCPEGAWSFADAGFLYHKGELEYLYGDRKEIEFYI